jgi:hypothetical protein
MYGLYQILRFVLKIFKFQIVWKYAIYLFIYCVIKYNFFLDVMYITPHLHVVKDFWNFEIMFNRFWNF